MPFFYLGTIIAKRNSDINKLINFVFKDLVRTIQPLQVEEEIKKLLEIVKKEKPRFILEIGTAKGGTLFLFSQVIPDGANIISVDLPKGEFGGGYSKWKIPFYKSFAKKNQKINLLRANSHSEETFEKVKKILNGNKLDFLFIDGDHSYEGVKKDFEMYSVLVKKNGVIALHDILKHATEPECQVNKFWDEIKKKNNFVEVIGDKKQGWAGIGIIKK